MIRICKNCFVLQTGRSAYVFRVTETGHLEHLHYGRPLGWDENTPEEHILADCEAMAVHKEFEDGNVISLDAEHRAVNLEDACLELSTTGKGDLRDTFVLLRRADGSVTSDFRFESALIGPIAPPDGMPGAYDEEGAAQRLTVTLRDRDDGMTLELYYDEFPDCGVLVRSARLINGGAAPVTVLRLMSAQLDFTPGQFELTTFHGAWAREMERETRKVDHVRLVNSSFGGTSSSRANPFVMLHAPGVTETAGNCYGVNLIYSGNHYTSVQTGPFGQVRLLTGISPEQFSWVLEPGESFCSPQCVLCFSHYGLGGMSRAMHAFVRRHIVRGVWRDKPRPVLLNSWEAFYFGVTEKKLLNLAKAGREIGAELLVLDDGWFAERDDDSHSLGDWRVNKKKFPDGLAGISRKVHELGLSFGLWIEPEMVSLNSDLYRDHTQWCMTAPGRDHSEGRSQRVLDLANPAVVDYLAKTLGELLEQAQVSYVKWDMNRVFSDVFSNSLPAERQGETAHRYIMGLYRLLDALTSRLPYVLFEGCASGGNRFDLGILCYCPQIWGSDNTDAVSRLTIQQGYSYGYPMNTVGAHISASPNHQTLRRTTMYTRFNVAAFGVLGLEYNLPDATAPTKETLKALIAVYKKWRDVLQFGEFHRLCDGNLTKWICVSPDKKRAVGLVAQVNAVPNYQYGDFRARGLDAKTRYHFYSLPQSVELRLFGDLINTVSPVHIKQDSQMHHLLNKVRSLPGEKEDCVVSGAVLMRSGVRLAPAYGGTGFNDKTRVFPDYTSRLYFMEAVE